MERKKIPVLFIIFNRPDLAKVTFEEIKKYKPERLFIAADGWRNDKEKKICEETRRCILQAVDWPCDVKTLFQNENLGCGKGPATAITWFFQNVPYGMILEDDCVPATDAFTFLEDVLPRYEKKENVMQVSLTKKTFPFSYKTSYTFSKYSECMGWASWARVWKDFEYNINLKKTISEIKPFKLFNPLEAMLHIMLWNRAWKNDLKKHGRLTFWDYQLCLLILKKRGLCIAPSFNMISNIGFGTGTHCPEKDHPLAELPFDKAVFPLIHPEKLIINNEFDKAFSRYWMKILFSNVWRALIRKKNRL